MITDEKLQEIIDYNLKVNDDAKTCEKFGIKQESLSRYQRAYMQRQEDMEDAMLKVNVKSYKQLQKQQDMNRIKNKTFREHSRIDNSIQELNSELISLLREHNVSHQTQFHEVKPAYYIPVMQLSDLHFNELINKDYNKYDFRIASARLKKYAERFKIIAHAFGATEIYVVSTGDLMNSDRRLDELLSQATNRSKAAFLSVHLLKQLLVDLNKNYNIKVAGVMGNESRLPKDFGYTDLVASDNYDFTIMNMLKVIFEGSEGVKFLDVDKMKTIISVNGKNILLTHNYNKAMSTEKGIQQTVGKHVLSDGVILDYVIGGHEHSAKIGDYGARSSALCGGNDYSDEGLNLAGRASQNMFLVSEHDIISIRVDLQDTTGYTGYEIDSKLEEYNAKSISKLHDKKTLVEVVV